MNKLLLLPAIGTALSTLNVNAAIIFNASTTNSGVVGNDFNLDSNSFTGTTGALSLTTVATPVPAPNGNTSGNNNASGLVSNENIDTLNGSPLVVTDTVTLKLAVSSTTGVTNLRANGIEFGLSPEGTGFRPDANLIFQIDADNDTSGMALGNISALTLNAAGWAVTEASLADGFDVNLVADNSGYTFTINGIQEVGNLTNTTLSYSNTFTENQFIDNFGGGHIYYTRQGSNGTANVNISEFSIDVTSVPEPSTSVLLGLLALGGMFTRRRA